MYLTVWIVFIVLEVLLSAWQWRRYRHESRAKRILALLSMVLIALYGPVGAWIARRWGFTAMVIGGLVTFLLTSFLSPPPKGERERQEAFIMARVNRFFAEREKKVQRHK